MVYVHFCMCLFERSHCYHLYIVSMPFNCQAWKSFSSCQIYSEECTRQRKLLTSNFYTQYTNYWDLWARDSSPLKNEGYGGSQSLSKTFCCNSIKCPPLVLVGFFDIDLNHVVGRIYHGCDEWTKQLSSNFDPNQGILVNHLCMFNIIYHFAEKF